MNEVLPEEINAFMGTLEAAFSFGNTQFLVQRETLDLEKIVGPVRKSRVGMDTIESLWESTKQRMLKNQNWFEEMEEGKKCKVQISTVENFEKVNQQKYEIPIEFEKEFSWLVLASNPLTPSQIKLRRIHRLSRVGFNSEQTQALVFSESDDTEHGLMGEGGLSLLEKKGHSWIFVGYRSWWTS